MADLLLLGHTKRMHLFEPRWVEMVDAARHDFGGIFGLVYVDNDGDVVRMCTVAEIVACANFGEAGRVVTVRGVGRAELRALSPEVISPDKWGVAQVKELPEIYAFDAPDPTEAPSSSSSSSSASAASSPFLRAAAELDALLQEGDLSDPNPSGTETSRLPAAASKGTGVAEGPGDHDDDGLGAVEEVELWTHQRVSPDEDFASVGAAAWPGRRAATERQLAGVPLAAAAGAPDLEEARPAIACLYAALSGAALTTRVEIFASPERGLAERLCAVAAVVRERQGMVRARRSLANIFAQEGPADGGTRPEGS